MSPISFFCEATSLGMIFLNTPMDYSSSDVDGDGIVEPWGQSSTMSELCAGANVESVCVSLLSNGSVEGTILSFFDESNS